MFASLVGEGYERPNADAESTLDVNYAKVGEWLLDRKLLSQDWTRKLQAIQAKVSEAVKELPPGFLGQFNGGDEVPVDYFRAKEILQKLTETAERGLLGSLKGSAGTWERIVKAYEANLLHAAEGGLTLARNVDFEIPYLKKQAAKNQQLMADLDRRAADSTKSAAVAVSDFHQECQAMGIPETATGNPAVLRRALLDLTQELPGLMGTAVDCVKAPSIGEAMQFYSKFIAAAAGEGGDKAAAVGAELPTLDEVREGRTAAPDGPMLPALEDNINESSGKGTQVQWDMPNESDTAIDASGSGGGGGGGMSWDIDVSEGGEGGAGDGIAWDIEVDSSAQDNSEHLENAGGAAPEVSWEIDISSAGEATQTEETTPADTEKQTATATSGEKNGAGSKAGYSNSMDTVDVEVQRLVADASYRALLLDDLFELRAFLVQRSSEMGGQGQQMVASLGTDLASIDIPTIKSMRSAGDAAIKCLTDARIAQLLSLATSAAYQDRLMAKFARYAGQEGKFLRAAADAEARKIDAQRQLVNDSTKLAVYVRRTKEAKAGVEAALGARLGRKVNVVGEINSVLAQS